MPPVFRSLAALYEPSDPSVPRQVVELARDWAIPDGIDPTAEVVLLGRMPARGRPGVATTVHAVRRERAIRDLRRRRPGDRTIAAIHRLRPVERPGRVRRAIRFAWMHGALVELTRGDRPERVLDSVVRAAGSVGAEPRIRPSGDGSALARLVTRDGMSVELRVARTGHTKDPFRGHAALVALAESGVPQVPRPVGSGMTPAARWSTETVVPGRLVDRLPGTVIDDVVALCARFPGSAMPDRATREHLALVARTFPSERQRLQDAADAVSRWSTGQGSVLLHGDLWRGNILVADGRLAGLIDWDTWHPAGLPGVDVLGLAMTEARARTGLQLGELFSRDHWRSDSVLELLGRALGLRGTRTPDAAGVAAIAVAWWAGHVGSSIHRGRRPAADAGWVAHNLQGPLDRIERLVRELETGGSQ